MCKLVFLKISQMKKCLFTIFAQKGFNFLMNYTNVSVHVALVIKSLKALTTFERTFLSMNAQDMPS